jgi:hypothetical protein
MEAHNVADYVVASLFLLILAVAMIASIQQMAQRHSIWLQRSMFFALIVLHSLLRFCFFVLQPPIRSHTLKNFPDWLDFLLNSLPGMLYLSSFSLYIWFWAEWYHYEHDSYMDHRLRNLRRPFNISNLIIYLFLAACYISLAASSKTDGSREQIKLVVVAGISALSIGLVVAFMVSGYHMWQKLDDMPQPEPRLKSQRMVTRITVLMVLLFFLRALFIIYSAARPSTQLSFQFIAGYYIALEVIPLGIMMASRIELPTSGQYTPLNEVWCYRCC